MVLWGGTVALAGDFEGQVDLTAEHTLTVTDVTRDVIHRVSKLNEPVRITGFAAPISNDASSFAALVKQYRSAGLDIDLEIIDPDLQPGRARQAGIGGQGEAVLEVGERQRGPHPDHAGGVTSALTRLSRPTRPVACFTAGHGERDPGDESRLGASKLAGALRGSGLRHQAARAGRRRCATTSWPAARW